MGPWGAIIMSLGGATFFVMAVVPVWGWRSPALLLPVIVMAAMLVAAWRQIARSPAGAHEPDVRSGRVISWATTGEAIGIPLVAVTLANTGHGALVLPGVALVVGLHFLPMAYAIPFRPFYALAAVLLAAAVAGTALSQPAGAMLAGVAAAAALWIASVAALRRGATVAA